jgi:two-component system, cell cycle sensor histidine kinase and response regulator CckA
LDILTGPGYKCDDNKAASGQRWAPGAILVPQRQHKSPAPVAGGNTFAMTACCDQIFELVDHLPDPAFAVDTGGRVVAWNPAIAELTGVPDQRIVGESEHAYAIPFYGHRRPMLVDAVLARDPGWERRYESVVRRGSSVSAESFAPQLRERGAYLWGSAAPLLSPGGELAGAIETIRDVTSLRCHRYEPASLDGMVDLLPHGLLLADPSGMIVYANAALETLIGIARSALVGRPLAALASTGPTSLPPAALAATERGVGWSGDVEAGSCEGRSVCTEWSLSPVRDAAGSVAGYVATARDRSHERELERLLRQAGAMEAACLLASGAAHDFNNLLTVIRGHAELVTATMKLSDPRRDDLAQILHAADRAGEMTRQLLAFFREQVLDPRVIDIGEAVGGVVPMLRHLVGELISVSIIARPGLWRVMADQGQLESAIVNLAVNARDAMPNGGHLAIRVANVDLDDRVVAAYAGPSTGRYVRISVLDTGVGMDGAIRARACEPYFTTKAPGRGTGLGLASVRGVVQRSGGFIHISSKPGLGTRVRIYLPAASEAQLGQAKLPAA